MYNWIWFVHVLFKVFLIIVGLVFICETILTSFGNCGGSSFFGLQGSLFYFVCPQSFDKEFCEIIWVTLAFERREESL